MPIETKRKITEQTVEIFIVEELERNEISPPSLAVKWAWKVHQKSKPCQSGGKKKTAEEVLNSVPTILLQIQYLQNDAG
jgi:hypothetical protein